MAQGISARRRAAPGADGVWRALTTPALARAAALACLVGLGGWPAAGLAHDPATAGGGAVAAPDFVPPPPGSYTLHRIMRAPDGDVLDVDGRARRLATFTTGKITLLGFVYTACSDARGCPLAYQVFHAIGDRVARAPTLRRQVRLVTLSFDPARDTPGVMKRYAGTSSATGVEWAFLTTRSPVELRPLLDGFGQDVRVLDRAEDDGEGPTLGHVLKVFLIDGAGMIREIYTTSYLLPDVVMNDIATLLLESAPRTD